MDHARNELSDCLGARNGNVEVLFSPDVNICSHTKDEEEERTIPDLVLTLVHALVRTLTHAVLDARESSRCGGFSLRRAARRQAGSGGADRQHAGPSGALMHASLTYMSSFVSPSCLLSGSSSSRRGPAQALI